MPAQSGDPISSALQSSLSGRSSQKDEDVTLLLLSYSAKQVLLSDIECEEYSYDSTSFLKGLKSKYILISDKDSEDSTNKPSTSTSGIVKPKISVSNCTERVKTIERPNFNDRKEGKHGNKPTLPTPSRTLWPPDAVSLGWKPNTPVGGGFINLWNSCYINSTLQALFHVPGFVNWLQTENSHKCPKKSNGTVDCLICSMALTLKNSQESTGKSIKPCLIYSRLKSICKHLNPGTQEDAHEFLRHLVDSLDKTYLSPYKDLRLDHLSKETTPLSQIFGGYLRNEVVCQSCGHVSTTFQYFQDLPLDIANSNYIDGALDHFFSKESVSEHEGYRCENCKRRVPFIKKFSIEKAPRVLCVQLKRFGALSGKNNKSFNIAGKLDLNKYRVIKTGGNIDPYELAAIVNHIGTSTSCGHYTTIALAADKRFYLFDDQRVERLHDLSPTSSQAYILLYHQKPSNVPNGTKPAFPSISHKMANSNGKNSTAPHESAKERIFGKGDSSKGNNKNPFKIFNNNVLTTVSNSISTVFSKVNGNGASCSHSNSVKSGTSSDTNGVKAGTSNDTNSVKSVTSNDTNSAKAGTSNDTKIVKSGTSDDSNESNIVNKTESADSEGNHTPNKTLTNFTDRTLTSIRNEKEDPSNNTENPKRNETSGNSVSRTIHFEPSKEKSTTKNSIDQSSSTSSMDSTRLQNGHKPNNINNKSLVPYNESSCSSDDGSLQGEDSCPQTREPTPEAGPSPPKKPRFDSERDSTESNRVRTNGSSSSDKNGASPSNRLNGHSSPGKQKYSNGNSSNVGQRYGKYPNKWMVTSRSPSTSPVKSEPTKNKWKIKGSDEGRHNHKSHHMPVNKLVSYWEGGSEMEKDVSRDNYNNPRSRNYNDNYTKKMKRRHKSRFDDNSSWFIKFKEESSSWGDDYKYNSQDREKAKRMGMNPHKFVRINRN